VSKPMGVSRQVGKRGVSKPLGGSKPAGVSEPMGESNGTLKIFIGVEKACAMTKISRFLRGRDWEGQVQGGVEPICMGKLWGKDSKQKRWGHPTRSPGVGN
jgi:hypothetical protein